MLSGVKSMFDLHRTRASKLSIRRSRTLFRVEEDFSRRWSRLDRKQICHYPLAGSSLSQSISPTAVWNSREIGSFPHRKQTIIMANEQSVFDVQLEWMFSEIQVRLQWVEDIHRFQSTRLAQKKIMSLSYDCDTFFVLFVAWNSHYNRPVQVHSTL